MEPVRNNGGALTGDIVLKLLNRETSRPITAHIDDASYGAPRRTVALGVAGSTTAHAEIAIPLSENHGWYDLRLFIEGVAGYEQRHAGRIEIGRESITDPAVGRT
jgi:phospholipase C